MNIARLEILENITDVQFMSLLQDPTKSINIEFNNFNKLVVVDIAPFFRSQEAIAGTLQSTLNFAQYHLDKDDIRLRILQDSNNFKISASKVINANDTTEDVLSVEYNLTVVVNTGNVVGEVLKTLNFNVNIDLDISQEIKDVFIENGLILTGVNWGDFTVNGKSNILFKKSDNKTVFIGNNDNGFLTI